MTHQKKTLKKNIDNKLRCFFAHWAQNTKKTPEKNTKKHVKNGSQSASTDITDLLSKRLQKPSHLFSRVVQQQ